MIGVDLVWAARDAHGRLAAFVTAGVGPIPAGAVDVEDALLELPKVCGATVYLAVPTPDSFIELSERGLFVFDWRDAHRTSRTSSGCYELVASPQHFASPSSTIPSVDLPDMDFASGAMVFLAPYD